MRSLGVEEVQYWYEMRSSAGRQKAHAKARRNIYAVRSMHDCLAGQLVGYQWELVMFGNHLEHQLSTPFLQAGSHCLSIVTCILFD